MVLRVLRRKVHVIRAAYANVRDPSDDGGEAHDGDKRNGDPGLVINPMAFVRLARRGISEEIVQTLPEAEFAELAHESDTFAQAESPSVEPEIFTPSITDNDFDAHGLGPNFGKLLIDVLSLVQRA